MAKNNRSGFLQGQEVFFTTNLKVVLYIGTASSTLDTGGVTLQALYSFAKEEWRTDNNLIKFPFPLLRLRVSNLN
jgi:hypothetical protein